MIYLSHFPSYCCLAAANGGWNGEEDENIVRLSLPFYIFDENESEEVNIGQYSNVTLFCSILSLIKKMLHFYVFCSPGTEILTIFPMVYCFHCLKILCFPLRTL